jgi:hypothetical protein
VLMFLTNCIIFFDNSDKFQINEAKVINLSIISDIYLVDLNFLTEFYFKIE